MYEESDNGEGYWGREVEKKVKFNAFSVKELSEKWYKGQYAVNKKVKDEKCGEG